MNQRIIKFRAWDGTKMLYQPDRDDAFVTTDGFKALMYRPLSALVGDSNDYTWMQFTGLKDKNGKEIYEGDVVHHDDSNWQVIYTADSEGVTRAAFMLDRRGDITTHSVKGMPAVDIEVIGNIYENPELLKEQTI